jgi:hypothetical protein
MFLAILVNGCVFVSLIWAAVRMLRQRRESRCHPRELIISTRAGLAMGAMMLGMQAIVQPQVRHVIVEQQKEDAPDDDSGEPPPGGRLFHQQLRRIRSGEEVDALILRVDGMRTDAVADTSQSRKE